MRPLTVPWRRCFAPARWRTRATSRGFAQPLLRKQETTCGAFYFSFSFLRPAFTPKVDVALTSPLLPRRVTRARCEADEYGATRPLIAKSGN